MHIYSNGTFGQKINTGLFYDHFTCAGILYHSCNNATLKIRNNSVVELTDGRYCEILTTDFICEIGLSGKNSICVLVRLVTIT